MLSTHDAKTLILFPHQLFAERPDCDRIVLIEDSLFFGDAEYPANFHQQKLVLHRASMQAFQSTLQSQSCTVDYVAYNERTLTEVFAKYATDQLLMFDVADFVLRRRIDQAQIQHSLNIKWLVTPQFLNTQGDNQAYRQSKNRWFMADFYQHQRRRLDIMVNADGQPDGGQWSFDHDNRKKLPKAKLAQLPLLNFPPETDVVIAAKQYVASVCPNAVGSADRFWYPITHQQAADWLTQFLEQRLFEFGPYEDALESDESWLYHSVLTPMLNIGLLTPHQVVAATLDFAKANQVPIASLEGFIRQIIGWREFMRATYDDLGVKMRTSNHWQHTRPLPSAFYDGSTGIEPIDNTIQRLLKTGYCHHIERLMVLGGFMFLCEIEPDAIYRWFMELFIDSYDWVMVTNVYAMSQHADGGLITTKPYFSGSNYVRKMSHYATGDWCDVWDGLYWRWIWRHHDELRNNPRWAMMCAAVRKMDKTKRQRHIDTAEQFLFEITKR